MPNLFPKRISLMLLCPRYQVILMPPISLITMPSPNNLLELQNLLNLSLSLSLANPKGKGPLIASLSSISPPLVIRTSVSNHPPLLVDPPSIQHQLTVDSVSAALAGESMGVSSESEEEFSNKEDDDMSGDDTADDSMTLNQY